MKKALAAVVIILAVLSIALMCFAGAIAVTDANYSDEVRRTYDPVVLEFWAPYCPACRKVVIRRSGFFVIETHLREGRCAFCQQPVKGVWA